MAARTKPTTTPPLLAERSSFTAQTFSEAAPVWLESRRPHIGPRRKKPYEDGADAKAAPKAGSGGEENR